MNWLGGHAILHLIITSRQLKFSSKFHVCIHHFFSKKSFRCTQLLKQHFKTNFLLPLRSPLWIQTDHLPLPLSNLQAKAASVPLIPSSSLSASASLWGWWTGSWGPGWKSRCHFDTSIWQGENISGKKSDYPPSSRPAFTYSHSSHLEWQYSMVTHVLHMMWKVREDRGT